MLPGKPRYHLPRPACRPVRQVTGSFHRSCRKTDGIIPTGLFHNPNGRNRPPVLINNCGMTKLAGDALPLSTLRPYPCLHGGPNRQGYRYQGSACNVVAVPGPDGGQQDGTTYVPFSSGNERQGRYKGFRLPRTTRNCARNRSSFLRAKPGGRGRKQLPDLRPYPASVDIHPVKQRGLPKAAKPVRLLPVGVFEMNTGRSPYRSAGVRSIYQAELICSDAGKSHTVYL